MIPHSDGLRTKTPGAFFRFVVLFAGAACAFSGPGGRLLRGEAFPDLRPGWDNPRPVPAELGNIEEAKAMFIRAELHSREANEALVRCRRYVDGWLGQTDPETGLIPRNLTESRDFWNGRDSAADNYPFMVLTAAITDPGLMRGRLSEMLRTEARLTCRLDRIPDDYSFSRKGWRRPQLIPEEIIFDGAEYVKDGLLPISEWLGPSEWSERMLGIVDDIWKNARIETASGSIPTLNFEVCGDLLQACSRLFWFTGDRKYVEWGFRLGDYYLLGTNHPTRNLRQLRLVDHGCEVVNGLTELYVAASFTDPGKREAYRKPIHEMIDCILEKGRNEDGLLYSWFEPRTGEHSKGLCDTWGYDLDGVYALWMVDKKESHLRAVRKALAALQGKYVGACWDDKSADGFADSIEGALNLLNRVPEPSAASWVDSQIRMMWAIQKPSGIIEGWHGDGNFARTSLMYALWKTQGTTVEPWRADVRWGAVATAEGLFLVLGSELPWEGSVKVDRIRHKDFMHLPLDYTRINQFPEWFTVRPQDRFTVQIGNQSTERTGTNLIDGLQFKLAAGELTWARVQHKP
jgi:hypothetical protein